ncbi:hypothetical protein NHQ30_009470 [Ciborinia camelliae]|nr:hypothetical protein NHQ30_009470 [Ciborinia camelliae]
MDLYILLYFLSFNAASASIITARASLPTILAASPILHARQTRITFSTCGFVNGNANQAVIAPTGSICRVDTGNGIWGVCTTSVIDLDPSECGWVGRCVDSSFCSTGCGLSNVAGYTTLHCSGASPFCQIAFSSALPRGSFTSLACGTQPVRETVFLTASTTAPIPASPELATSVAVSTSEQSSSPAQTTTGSNLQSNSESTSASATIPETKTSRKSSGSESITNSASSRASESQSSDIATASLDGSSPRESVFTISGSLITSFFGQTNTIETTISITTTASDITSPTPSNSTSPTPTPKNPPKYNFRALIGIVIGILIFLLLLIFTLIWIGKYRRARGEKGSTSSSHQVETPINFFFSNLPEVMEPFAKTDGVHEIYDHRGEFRELDVAGAVAGRMGRVSVRELAATPVMGGRRSARRSARELYGDVGGVGGE